MKHVAKLLIGFGMPILTGCTALAERGPTQEQKT